MYAKSLWGIRKDQLQNVIIVYQKFLLIDRFHPLQIKLPKNAPASKALVRQKRRKQQLAKIKQLKPRVKKTSAKKPPAKEIEKDTAKTAAPKQPAKK